ncbi:MAG: hypothetical protein AAF581_08880 [Planctomycetota bacterium]
MLKRIRKVGNSCALILDKPILEMLGLAVGSEVRMRLHGGALSIAPVELIPGLDAELGQISEGLRSIESEQRNVESLSALLTLRQQLRKIEGDVALPYQELTGALDKHRCRYAVVGDIAASVHGEPRMLSRIEVLLQVTAKSKKLRNLLRDLDKAGFDFDFDLDSAVKAWDRAGAIEMKHGKTVARLVAAREPIQIEACKRAQPIEVLGRSARLASAEDCILERVQSWRLKDVPIALEVAKRQSATLDRAYLGRWTHTISRENLAVKERVAALFDNQRELPPGIRDQQPTDSSA